MFTERQQELIDYCKRRGYGYKKFAESVEKSGKCSDKQLATMISMYTKISGFSYIEGQGLHYVSARRIHTPFKRKPHSYCEDDISDNEAMSMGEYF